MIGDFATAGAGVSASGASGTLTMARVDAPRRAPAPLPLPLSATLTPVAHGSPDGPIGVRMFYLMCWVIYAGTAVQWLAGH